MHKRTSGFTIIELTVVIVIVAVVAMISLVSFNGVRDRALATQTITAGEQYAKALLMYRARNGSFPTPSSGTSACLGTNYGYNLDGLGTSGVGQCRQDTAVMGTKVDSAFNTELGKYMTSNPTPAMVTTVNAAPNYWYRGLIFYTDISSNVSIDMTLPGSVTCPSALGGFVLTRGGDLRANGNRLCGYTLGASTGY